MAMTIRQKTVIKTLWKRKHKFVINMKHFYITKNISAVKDILTFKNNDSDVKDLFD